MNEYERLHRLAQRHREIYPPGTRVELIDMSDPYTPVPSGTRGTVKFIDDMAQIHMKWDNGRTRVSRSAKPHTCAYAQTHQSDAPVPPRYANDVII